MISSPHSNFIRYVAGLALAIGSAAGMPVTNQAIAGEPGATRVAEWAGDARAPFMLMFDDSMTGHVKTVLPELKRRKLVGTFYVNPGSGHYKAMHEAWEKEFTAAGMVLANHTFTHKGCKDLADCESEITQCSDVLYATAAANGQTKPTLLSFGRPGVPQGKWNVTDEELETLLAKHGLVRRPNVLFAQIHLKDAQAMIARVEKALAIGKPDVVAFHGVGGEWLSIDTPAFLALLDFIDEHRRELWVTDPISIHKYETERATAEVKVERAGADEIRLTLGSQADPKIYDAPLTLVTEVPAAWKRVEIRQGSRTTTATAADGKVIYDARPGNEPVTLKPGP
jgi:peptidoglycan/xylan/chitin deacetylase (PgdA/CDA1 family)